MEAIEGKDLSLKKVPRIPIKRLKSRKFLFYIVENPDTEIDIKQCNINKQDVNWIEHVMDQFDEVQTFLEKKWKLAEKKEF